MAIGVEREWQSVHVHYHADIGPLLTGWLTPTVRDLLRNRRIRRFFFLRYGLGGPHVRLRVEPTDGIDPGEIREIVDRRANDFLAEHPSTAAIDAETIEQRDRGLLASDDNEHDATAYPDNHVRWAEFVPETERYGGLTRLDDSLELFCLSSIEALSFLEACGDLPTARRLPRALARLIHLAAGLAEGSDALVRLLGYAVEYWGEPMADAVERADASYDRQPDAFRRLVRSALELAPTARLTAAGGHLRCTTLAGADAAMRWVVASSQMHMTANRLGLRNSDEVYAGRMVWRAARDIADTTTFEGFDDTPNADPRPAADALRILTEMACTTWSEGPED